MKLTREQAFDIITNNGIVLHECNKQETSTNSIYYMTDEELIMLLNDECGMNVSGILHTRKNDNYINGFENRNERYKQYDIIDNIIAENEKNGKYITHSFMVDRMDSELKHMFIIRANNFHCCAIAFNSISEFEKWING